MGVERWWLNFQEVLGEKMSSFARGSRLRRLELCLLESHVSLFSRPGEGGGEGKLCGSTLGDRSANWLPWLLPSFSGPMTLT